MVIKFNNLDLNNLEFLDGLLASQQKFLFWIAFKGKKKKFIGTFSEYMESFKSAPQILKMFSIPEYGQFNVIW